MKVCPECSREFDVELETCPDDGASLVNASVPLNPSLREVMQVAPSEATSMIDLEAFEQARRERMIARGEDPDAVDAPVTAEAPPDPDATGLLDLASLERKRAATQSAEAVGTEAPMEQEPRKERTLLTRSREPSVASEPPTTARLDERARSRPQLRWIGAAALVLLLVAGLGIWFWTQSRGAVLTVTSVPPGATVRLDEIEFGVAPVQRRVAVGLHRIELSLDGYEPHAESIEVPPEGLPFMQPLRAAPPKPPEPTAEERAAQQIAVIEALIASGDLEAALDAVKAFLREFPDDPRGDKLLDRVIGLRAKLAADPTKPRVQRAPTKSRAEQIRDACDGGSAAYQDGDLASAKVQLQTCLQLSPKRSAPHRLLARIYQRERNDDRARYHLQRFLALGGADPDFKVRRWLEEHPAP